MTRYTVQFRDIQPPHQIADVWIDADGYEEATQKAEASCKYWRGFVWHATIWRPKHADDTESTSALPPGQHGTTNL